MMWFLFCLMSRRPPRSTLFPNTTPFRSDVQQRHRPGDDLLRRERVHHLLRLVQQEPEVPGVHSEERHPQPPVPLDGPEHQDRKSTRLNSSHANISYAVFCLQKKIPPTLT